MKKHSGKNKERGKDAYTVTEVGILIEEFRGEFKVFGEKLQANTEKLDATYKQVGKNTEEITLLKVAVQNITAKIDKLVESIEELIKTKVDREELHSLEVRVGALEAKVASLTN